MNKLKKEKSKNEKYFVKRIWARFFKHRLRKSTKNSPGGPNTGSRGD